MTTTTAFNIFAEAKKVEPKRTTTKDKEKVLYNGIEKDLLRYNEIKIEENNLKAEKEMLAGRLKEIGKSEFLKKYGQQKSRPDSFHLVDGHGKVMVIVMDAYKKIEEAKESALEAYTGVIETERIFTINKDILSKEGVGEALSEAIMNAEGISDEDKRNLLLCEETKAIKKGTIDRLLTFDNYEHLFNLIEPTIQLK